MKRLKTRRNRKHIDLVELVRNRFRFQPYRFHSNANISSRSSTQLVPNVRSSRFASAENLPKNQRLRLGHSKRAGVVTRTAAEGEPHPSGSVSVSPPCSSRQMYRDETSQTSIPKELIHLLLDDGKHSDEDDEGNTTAAETSVGTEEHSSNTSTEMPTSNKLVTEQQDVNTSELCSNEQRASACLSAAVQAMVDSDPDEADETEETEDTEDPRETEDGEDTEDAEEAHETVSVHERNELVSDLDHFLHEHRSQVLPEEETTADEEAGGDGHHNNSVIEIEITLTSGNDSNSEEDENDTDAIGDDESEDI